MALESFLQHRVGVARFAHLCQERLLLDLVLQQQFLDLIVLLAELVELLPVCPVVVPLLRELGIVALESLLQHRVGVACFAHLCQERLLLDLVLRQLLLDLVVLLAELLELLPLCPVIVPLLR